MVPARTGLRVAGVAVQAFFRAVGKVVGSEVIEDIVAFFRAFEGMEQGFRERATSVTALLADPATGFVLVTSPRHDAVEEAQFFAERLRASQLTVAALVVNRVHPHFGEGLDLDRLHERAAELATRAEEESGDDARGRRAARRRGTGTSPTTPRSPAPSAGSSTMRPVGSVPRLLRTCRPSRTTSSTSRHWTRSRRTCSPSAEPGSVRGRCPTGARRSSSPRTERGSAIASGARSPARDHEVIELTRGEDVRDAVAAHAPDLVILDMQIGNMGGVAVAIDLHLEASADRLPDVPVLLLLDREHDRFLAKRASADAELVKPVDPGTLRRTVARLLSGRAPALSAASYDQTVRRGSRLHSIVPTGCGAVW